jgi:hypothetical protein
MEYLVLVLAEHADADGFRLDLRRNIAPGDGAATAGDSEATGTARAK